MARTQEEGVKRCLDNCNTSSNSNNFDTNMDSNDNIIKESTNEVIGEEMTKKDNQCLANTSAETKANTSTDNEANNENSIKKFKVYFIELKAITSTSVGRQPKSMQMAFTLMKAYKYDPNWIKEEEVLDAKWKQTNNCLFIVDSFDGKVFEQLSAKKLRIIGPLTVLYCYSSECSDRSKSIPLKVVPILSQCMRKLFISISGFDGNRKSELISKIERMCGNFNKDFTKRVTYLVTDSVRTKKYKVAKKQGIPVLIANWVDDCWNDYQHKLLSAADKPIVDKYMIKMFNKLVISVSQVDVEERNEVKAIVKNNGGEYSPSLKLNVQNSILLLKEPTGEKFKYAQLRAIPCLDIKWLYDSIKEGYALSEENYLIVSMASQKSQLRSQQRTHNQCEPTSKSVPIVNTITSIKSSQSTVARLENTSTNNNNSVSVADSSEDITKRLEVLLKARKDEPFLEGCDVYVIGFERPVYESIKSALISIGSVVFNEFKNIVTHVIVGPNCDDNELEPLLMNKSSKLVSIEWLFECLRQSECFDCSKYEIKSPKLSEGNNSSGTESNKCKTPDIIDGPLTIVCPLLAQKALNKWNDEFKNDPKDNHKSLGDRMNNKIDVEWNDGSSDGIPSQRPYVSQEKNESVNGSNEPKSPQIDNKLKNSQSEDMEVVIEEDCEDISTAKIKPIAKKGFMFSGYDDQTKSEFKQIVESLNGLVFESNCLSDSVTHLVIRDPSATEKTLSAIAAGIWVLKEDYLTESRDNNMFVEEDQFEWGFALMNETDSKSVRKRLMISAVNWRKHLTQDANIRADKPKKIFDNWNVLMLMETKSTISYSQVLRNGSANVTLMSSAVDERQLKRFRFAFADQNAIKDLPKYALKLAQSLLKEQKLLKIDFVSYYILSGPDSDLSHILAKCLIKDSVLNGLQTQTPSLKRNRDDSEQHSNSKHKK